MLIYFEKNNVVPTRYLTLKNLITATKQLMFVAETEDA